MMSNINISLEKEINETNSTDIIKNEAIKILKMISEGDSDDKIKITIQDDIYEMISKEKANEGDEE